MSELTPNNIPEPDKSVAEIHAEAIDKATKIYAMLKEAGYTAEDLAVTDFLINPHRPPMPPCPPPKPPCPPPCPPKPPKCEVAEYTAPRPIVHPHAPHHDHDHNMPPCPPPVKPMPICPPPNAVPLPFIKDQHCAFPPYQGGTGGVRPPMPNGGTAQRVAQADWNEQNPFSASYICNKPNVVLEINGIKPDPENGKLELDPQNLGMETLSNEEISSIINSVFHIFETEKSNCTCGCNA